MKSFFLFVAFAVCANSFAQHPNEARELALNGLSLLETGDFESGIKLLKKARNKAPGVYDYSFELASAYLQSGKHRLAEKHFYPLQFHDNAQADVFIKLSQCYYEINESRNNPDATRSKELNTLRTGIEKLPRSGILYLELAKRQLELEEPKKALAALDAGIKNAPDFSDNYFWASKIYVLSGQVEKAWLHAELFYNMTDDIEMARTAALVVRQTTEKLFGAESGTKSVLPTCKCSGMDLNDWKQQRLCLSELKKRDHSTMLQTLTNRLTELDEQGFMEAYVASIYLLQDKEQFLAWLAANGKLFETYRQWRNWNPLNAPQNN